VKPTARRWKRPIKTAHFAGFNLELERISHDLIPARPLAFLILIAKRKARIPRHCKLQLVGEDIAFFREMVFGQQALWLLNPLPSSLQDEFTFAGLARHWRVRLRSGALPGSNGKEHFACVCFILE
jgi:hypothetical protein